MPSSAIGLSRHGESVFDGAVMPTRIEPSTSVDSFLARLIWVVPSCSATPISSRWCCATPTTSVLGDDVYFETLLVAVVVQCVAKAPVG